MSDSVGFTKAIIWSVGLKLTWLNDCRFLSGERKALHGGQETGEKEINFHLLKPK